METGGGDMTEEEQSVEHKDGNAHAVLSARL